MYTSFIRDSCNINKKVVILWIIINITSQSSASAIVVAINSDKFQWKLIPCKIYLILIGSVR